METTQALRMKAQNGRVTKHLRLISPKRNFKIEIFSYIKSRNSSYVKKWKNILSSGIFLGSQCSQHHQATLRKKSYWHLSNQKLKLIKYSMEPFLEVKIKESTTSWKVSVLFSIYDIIQSVRIY